MRARVLPLLAVMLFVLPSCGPSIPTRFVLERDIDHWSYRRYQRVLDVEIQVANNPAVGHTATYVQRATRTSRAIPFANVFVVVYENPQGLAGEVREQVRALGSYETSVREMGGGRVWYLDAGPGDRWALWVSGAHVVKVGASEGIDEVPQEVVSAYMSIYPSDLDEHGRAREGTASAGELPSATAEGTTSGGSSGESASEGSSERSSEGSGEGSGEGSSGENEEDMPGFLRNTAPR